jgi:hypothetical protein
MTKFQQKTCEFATTPEDQSTVCGKTATHWWNSDMDPNGPFPLCDEHFDLFMDAELNAKKYKVGSLEWFKLADQTERDSKYPERAKKYLDGLRAKALKGIELGNGEKVSPREFWLGMLTERVKNGVTAMTDGECAASAARFIHGKGFRLVIECDETATTMNLEVIGKA